jgi:hypothetical protein
MVRRLAASLFALALAAGAAPPPIVALDAGATNTVLVAGGAAYVADPHVVVALTSTDASVTTVRLTVDGATWRELPMAPAIDIDLTDPGIGGTTSDAQFTVSVAFGDGSTFGDPVTDTVSLDRTGPVWPGFDLEPQYNVFDPTVTADSIVDYGAGPDGWRYSFDNVHWASWRTSPVLDFRDPAAGGSWTQGTRQAWVQARDRLGNTSKALTDTTVLSVEPYYDLPVTMEYPLPAVTGQPFTIHPRLPLDMAPPPDAQCYWRLTWGNDAAILDRQWNDTWGLVDFNGKGTRGGCDAWTFTLPYAAVLQYRIEFSMCIVDGTNCGGAAFADEVFHAAWGTSERRILVSNHPLAYILPDRYDTVVGEPITYTLHTVGGYALPARSIWTTQCYCRLGPYPVQHGGTTFTFSPDTLGNWIVWWNGGSGLFEFAAGYDPAARRRDTTRPTTTAPVARIGGGLPGDTLPVTVSWTGGDAGWGIDHYRLWKSVDGGAWTSVKLARPKSTSAVAWTQPGHSVRFKVRAWDKAGNAGVEDIGPILRPALVSDASPTLAYAGTWTAVADVTALGGGLHESPTASSTARLTFAGRDVAWVAEKGPGHGKAVVRIDGRIVATVDLNASTDGARRIVFARHWATRGTHTIVITVQGTAGRPLVSVDGFAVLR